MRMIEEILHQEVFYDSCKSSNMDFVIKAIGHTPAPEAHRATLTHGASLGNIAVTYILHSTSS